MPLINPPITHLQTTSGTLPAFSGRIDSTPRTAERGTFSASMTPLASCAELLHDPRLKASTALMAEIQQPNSCRLLEGSNINTETISSLAGAGLLETHSSTQYRAKTHLQICILQESPARTNPNPRTGTRDTKTLKFCRETDEKDGYPTYLIRGLRTFSLHV